MENNRNNDQENKNIFDRMGNVIKLRGTYKDLCIRNGAGVFFSKKRLTIKQKRAAAFATDYF